ncbi:MAG: hypothetical protein IPK67_10170 [Planctomycetes bacterium]|nr:hypothetical protein [Planctomycetota bacterium]
MEFRPGTCSACKASFKIPATFTANKAKCSKCGGVVEIGPVTSEAAAPAKPVPTPGAAKAVSAPVASAAARLAEKPGAAPASGAPRPVPARPVSQPAAAPAAKAPAPAAPSTAPKAPAAPAHKPVLPAAAKISPKPAAAAAKPAAHKPSKKVEEIEEQDDDERASRRARVEKKKGPNLLLLGGALVGLAAIGVVVFKLWSDDKATKAALAEASAAEKAAKDKEREAKAQQDLEEAQREEQKRIEEKAAKDKLAAEAKAAKDAEKTLNAEAQAAAKAAAAKGPVEGFDLSTIPDFEPYPGTTPEQWEEIQQLATTWFDPLAGARASRARAKLEENPQQAFPAILNGLKKLNLEEEDGYRIADATQKMLEKICHGHNAGWKYRTEENWLQYDQKAIKLWCDMWTKASTDEAYWKKLTKQDQAEAPAEGEAGAAPAKKVDDF